MSVDALAAYLKQMTPKTNDLADMVYGTVTGTSPLKIRVDNMTFDLDNRFFILSRMVRNLTVTITIDGKSGSAQVFRPLETGDRVSMLRVQHGQKFYVLERS